jgi:hypothetical protein
MLEMVVSSESMFARIRDQCFLHRCFMLTFAAKITRLRSL